jgi:peptidoglycan/xylan/chitin deacetylase (PgdA/CDA1 family)
LARAGVEIGAHTRTHADLGRLHDPAALHDELVSGGEELQAAVGTPVHMSAAAFHLAYEAGYEAVCSAYGGYNLPGDDPFHLKRLGADGPLLRMQLWAEFDRRQDRRAQRFDYGMPPSVRTPVGATYP